MEEKRTYQSDAGQTVTVWNKQQTAWREQRCYRIEGSGELGLFVGEGETAAIVLHIEEHNNGTWSLWYKLNNDYFDTYTRELAEIGEW